MPFSLFDSRDGARVVRLSLSPSPKHPSDLLFQAPTEASKAIEPQAQASAPVRLSSFPWKKCSPLSSLHLAQQLLRP